MSLVRTLHLSVITGCGIGILVITGLYFIYDDHQPDQVIQLSKTQPSVDYQSQNTSSVQTIAQTEQPQTEKNNFSQYMKTPIWSYNTDGRILSIVTSYHGSYIVAGTRIQEMHADDNEHQGSVYFFDKTGNLIWKYDSTRKIGTVAVSDDGQYVLASGYQIAPGPAGIYENGAMYFLDKNGNMLWDYTPNDYGQILVSSLSSDGSHVAAASGNNLVYFDNSGKKLWNYTSSSAINVISVSSDGSNVITSSGNVIHFFDKKGNLLWTFNTDYGAGQTRISPDGKYIITSDTPSGYDGKIYFIDNKGSLIKESQIGSPVLSLSISEDSSHILLAPTGQQWLSIQLETRSGATRYHHRWQCHQMVHFLQLYQVQAMEYT